MNNDLKISMKLVSSDNINMKLEDSKPIDVNMNGGIVEIDPIFTDSPAYTITYSDITKWNNKSNFSGDYNDLTNKPLIPTKTSELTNNSGFIDKNVNNLANYTLSTNISEVGLTGNYSDLIDPPIIPTKTSDLNNDSGFITNTVNNLTNYTLTTNLATVATTGSYTDLSNTPTLSLVATSGLYNDLLNKPTLSTVASTGDYDDLIDKPTIPTKTSDLQNDSGYITSANIPSKTSDLQNDSGFITNTVNDLTNYTLSSSLSSVATSGSYNDLIDKPTLATFNIYSTTETVIGTFLGKPLYRIVIETTTPSTTPGNVATITNLGKMVNLYGFIINGTQQIPMNYSYASNEITSLYVSGTSIQFNTNYANYKGKDCYFIAEYTKSTD